MVAVGFVLESPLFVSEIQVWDFSALPTLPELLAGSATISTYITTPLWFRKAELMKTVKQ